MVSCTGDNFLQRVGGFEGEGRGQALAESPRTGPEAQD